jgi:AcrR family transcriptional regulator
MQEEKSRIPNSDRRAAMRARLLASARRLFVEKGYAETSTPEIVKDAGVTRGALYHHFDDKAALFDALIRAEAESLAADIELAALGNAGDSMQAGAKAFFAAMSHPGRARLLLVDGPAALGQARMDEIDAGNGRRTLRDGLAAASPDLPSEELDALSLLLSAAFDRAAQAIADGTDEAPLLAGILMLISGVTRG